MTIDSNVAYGLAAIAAGNADHAEHMRSNDLATSTTDTLANVLHACGRLGIDFDQALDSARMHFEAEKADGTERHRHPGAERDCHCPHPESPYPTLDY